MDMTLDTMRIIFVSKGYKFFAAFCGFFQVLIWLIAITLVMKNLNNVFNYIAYAAGFASGNILGMIIEEKIALGNVLIRVVTSSDVAELIEYMKSRKFGVTVLDAKGLYGNVKILFTILPRTEIEQVVAFIKKINPQAFYTIEDVRFVNEKTFSFNSFSSLPPTFAFLRRAFRLGR
jgi:uncharacterized protein YebE (UPF0316 family)